MKHTHANSNTVSMLKSQQEICRNVCTHECSTCQSAEKLQLEHIGQINI